MLVIELAPAELAAAVTGRSRAPTIGIGAGPGTDGQVLVFPDVLGYIEKNFRHNRRYAEVGADHARGRRAPIWPTCGRRNFRPWPTRRHAGGGFAQFKAEILGEKSELRKAAALGRLVAFPSSRRSAWNR